MKFIHMDFISLWDEQHEKARLQKQKLDAKSEDYWNDKKNVARFTEHLTEDRHGRVAWQISAMNIEPGSSVLDIGAGPGTLAIPLALAGCRVTALEPSEAMREAMQVYRQVTGAPEISSVASRWEDAGDVGKFDYVISSYAFMFGNIRDVISRMNNAARREVHIFWFFKSPSASRGNVDLWPRLYGEEYCHDPTADVLWNVLCQLGIYANIVVEQRKKNQAFAEMEDLYADFEKRMVVKDECQRKIVREYVDEKVVSTKDGFVVPGYTLSAHIWWKKEEDI
ncbi:MAG TPA: class I SAM-dependent methyltransferase [Methanocorpusculum sp.]|nr:class I SAM-dependent methyltransferase [Methanocorpusculum sp.]